MVFVVIGFTLLGALVGAGLIMLSFVSSSRVAMLTPERRQLLRGVGIMLIVIAAFAPPALMLISGP